VTRGPAPGGLEAGGRRLPGESRRIQRRPIRRTLEAGARRGDRPAAQQAGVETSGKSSSVLIDVPGPTRSSIAARASAAVNPGVVRRSSCTSAWSGTRLGCTPLWKMPTLTVAGPCEGLLGHSGCRCTRAAASASATRAFSPSSGRDPCARSA